MATRPTTSAAIVHDTPVRSRESADFWGSDAVAAMLRELGIRYIALNPGASYRGFHDSIVNYLGNRDPQMVLCLHDETAVAIAHGYWKASDEMMAAALHSNVGLMHATHGDLRRLVRPCPGAGHGRNRPVGRDEAPAVDRLDPHLLPTRARSSATTPSGTTSRVPWAPPWRRCCAARRSRRRRRAGPFTSTWTTRCRRRRSGRSRPCRRWRATPRRRSCARTLKPWRPRHVCFPARRARSCWPGAARAARTAGRRAWRSPKSSTCARSPISRWRRHSRPITACTWAPPANRLSRRPAEAARRGRRHSLARLARPRGNAQAGVRRRSR